jgi:predicted dienelactone hydrolase
MTTMAHAIGYKSVHGENMSSVSLPIHLLYPTAAIETKLSFGPYEISAAPDSEPIERNLPLVAVSHGSGSTPWVHRDLARSLALQGFVVVLPEHIGNCRVDDSLAGTEELLRRRPAQLSAAIDGAMAQPMIGPYLRSKTIGLIGTSIGAYTTLALAGGKPWSGDHESPTGTARPLSIAHRDDIGAIVLLSPALYWFLPEGSLDEIAAPILLRRGEQDNVTPPSHTALLRERLPVDAHLLDECVPNAGHFSFMSAFPAALARPGFAPAQDPDGFDRVEYQSRLHEDVAKFLGERLT